MSAGLLGTRSLRWLAEAVWCQLDQNQVTPLAGTENASGPFFSPDGEWIGFFADGKLKKISAGGGDAVTLCEKGGGSPFPLGGSNSSVGAAVVVSLGPINPCGLSGLRSLHPTARMLTPYALACMVNFAHITKSSNAKSHYSHGPLPSGCRFMDELEAAGLDARLVNPLEAKRRIGGRNKTDKLDARGVEKAKRERHNLPLSVSGARRRCGRVGGRDRQPVEEQSSAERGEGRVQAKENT
jgi:hypothetical protein